MKNNNAYITDNFKEICRNSDDIQGAQDNIATWLIENNINLSGVGVELRNDILSRYFNEEL